MIRQLTWDDVFRNVRITTGEVETVEGDDVYRGPIASLTYGDGVVEIETHWTAIQSVLTGEWKQWSKVGLTVRQATVPWGLDDGRIIVSTTEFGYVTLIPRGHEPLLSSAVKGLTAH